MSLNPVQALVSGSITSRCIQPHSVPQRACSLLNASWARFCTICQNVLNSVMIGCTTTALNHSQAAAHTS